MRPSPPPFDETDDKFVKNANREWIPSGDCDSNNGGFLFGAVIVLSTFYDPEWTTTHPCGVGFFA